MTITSAKEFSVRATRANREREYTVTYKIVSNDKNDGPVTIFNSGVGDIPSFGSSYSYGGESDAGALMAERTCERLEEDGSFIHWRMTATFTTDGERQANEDEEEGPDNPVDKPWEWSTSWNNYQTTKTRDLHGRIYATAAGEPFDPPKQIDSPKIVVVATKNFYSFDPNWLVYSNQFDGAVVNDDPLWGLPPRTIKIQNISAKQVYYGAGDYWRATFSFEVMETGWDQNELNAGFKEFDANNNIRHITKPDSFGRQTPVSEPWPLDATGVALSDADVIAEEFTYVPDDEISDKFEFYIQLPFAAGLGVPDVIGAPF